MSRMGSVAIGVLARGAPLGPFSAAPAASSLRNTSVAQLGSMRSGASDMPSGVGAVLRPEWWPWCSCPPRIRVRQTERVYVPMVLRRCGKDHPWEPWRGQPFFCCPEDPYPLKDAARQHRWLWAADLDLCGDDDGEQQSNGSARTYGMEGVMSERPTNFGNDVGMSADETPEEIGSFLRRLAAGVEAEAQVDKRPGPTGHGLVAALAQARWLEEAEAAKAAASAAAAAKRTSVVQQLTSHRKRRA